MLVYQRVKLVGHLFEKSMKNEDVGPLKLYNSLLDGCGDWHKWH
jgi:hypothetical protein